MHSIVKTEKIVNPATANNVIPSGIFHALKRLVAIATNITSKPITPNIAIIPSFMATVCEGIKVNDNRLTV